MMFDESVIHGGFKFIFTPNVPSRKSVLQHVTSSCQILKVHTSPFTACLPSVSHEQSCIQPKKEKRFVIVQDQGRSPSAARCLA